MSISLQQQYGPNGTCFGCGPKNEKGLQIQSYVAENGDITCQFTPEKHHEAFDGVVNGGIIGALMDCHSNWTAAYSIMKHREADTLPWTVTADFHVKLAAPTPSDQTLTLKARPTIVEHNKAKIECEIWAGEQKTATCTGLFVAVKEGHPAFNRWN